MEVTKCLKPSDSGSRIGDRASVQAATRVSAPGDRQGVCGEVHCDEGVAIHVAPDPCAVLREDDCEASVGERIGQPLSRESVSKLGCRRCSLDGRQNWRARYCERPPDPAWS